MYNDKVNNEQLIYEVSKYVELYDCKHKNYFEPDHRNNVWQNIAKLVDSSAEVCKSRWRNLRTSFVNELKKISEKGETNKKWMYYEQMLFLLPYVQKYKRYRSVPSIEEAYNHYEYEMPPPVATDEDNSEDIDTKEFIQLNNDLSEDYVDSPTENSNTESERLQTENQNQETSNDEALKHFFTAMYATVKKFPPHLQITAKKMIFSQVTDLEESLHLQYLPNSSRN